MLGPGGWFHAESAGAGNLAGRVAALGGVAAELGLPPAQVTFLTAGTALELIEAAGFEVGIEGVRTIAQRRSFTKDELIALVRTQATPAYPIVDDHLRRLFLSKAQTAVEQLRRTDGSWDQTFVRLEVLVRRP